LRRLYFFSIIILLLVFSCSEDPYLSLRARFDEAYLIKILKIAKNSIQAEFTTPRFSCFQEIPYTESELGVFVRLINKGQDRGCVGFYRGVSSPEQAAALAAVDAAFFDGRYPVLKKEELDTCELEVTVIGALQPIAGPEDFDLQRHMLRIELGLQEAMLQPQIAAEHGYDKKAFLRALCRKAGLPQDSYLDAAARLFKAPAVHRCEPFSEL
jgi:AmmeMemoRadiSam system protein A